MLDAQRNVPGHFRWLAMVRGLVAIAAGIIAFVWPGISLVVLVFIFGAYSLINGVLAIIVAFLARSITSSWWALLIEGLVGIAIGATTFFWPHITIFALLLLIAIWAVLLGIFEISAAFTSHAGTGERWMLGVAGALSILFGVLLLVHPGVGLLTVVWLVGFYAIAWGITLIAHSFQQHGPTAPPSLEHEV
ncbi:MAG: HdeD family acid-resistance protein [Ktedonobacteraceae bacterium]